MPTRRQAPRVSPMLGRIARTLLRGSGRRPVALVAAAALVVWPLVVGLLTAYDTVQQPSYYQGALDRAQVYDRLYTRVLTDPQIVDVTEQLMARLPVDRTVVTDNLRVVIPPAALRGAASELSEEAAGYFAGGGDALELRVDLQPVFANIARLVSLYLLGRLSEARTYRAPDVAALVRTVLAEMLLMSRGVPPTSVPSLTLSAEQAATVADRMIAMLPVAQQSTDLHDQLVVLLRSGDLPGALALVGPMVFHGAGDAILDLQERLGGSRLDLGSPFVDTAHTPVGRAVGAVHALGGTGVIALAAGLVAALVVAVGLVAAHLRRAGRRRLPVVVAALLGAGAGGVLSLLAARLLLTQLRARTAEAAATLPAGVRSLVDDVAHSLATELEADWTRLAAVPFVLVAVVAALRLLTRPVLARSLVELRHGRVGRRAAAKLAGAVVTMSTLMWLVVPVATNAGTVVCNGSPQLCSRRYDQVTYPASHNAMAASDADFLAPDQDLDITGQLDVGVRALLVDVHHWTTAYEVEDFLARLPADQRATLEPFVRAPLVPHAGLWLCHNVCQLGALDLVNQLQRLRTWLDTNRTEVVTLIVQDEVPAREVMAAFEAAGLGPYLATPPEEPDGRWPTLGTLVRQGHRLVVLPERADEPGTWYRQLFRYASDTPFRVASPGGFTCDPDRGDVRAPILLVNHWVSRAAGSRYDASLVNQRSSLLQHVQSCRKVRDRRPTYLAVDFAGIGDLIPTVAELNRAS